MFLTACKCNEKAICFSLLLFSVSFHCATGAFCQICKTSYLRRSAYITPKNTDKGKKPFYAMGTRMSSSSTERHVNELEREEQNDVAENVVTDSEGEDEFIRKYGEIDFKYIKRPKPAVWFIRPHALNYFENGVLYRTKGERTSGKTELFLDLMYVGIIANVAGEASEHASWGSFLQYVLFFIPYWTVWADIKDFTNYYYSEDLSQKTYILWILILLTLSVNSHSHVLKDRHGAALTIVPYILCRLSLAVSLLVYSFFIPQHRAQMRLYFCFLIATSCLWIPVIFISTRAKVAVSFVAIFCEQVSFCIVFHPRTKRWLKLTQSTALNIEHEVERLATFVTIAIGEFLYKVVASSPLGVGMTTAFGRGCFLLIIAYNLFWLFYNGGTSDKAIHPLRHSAFRAILWIYAHLPLVAAIVLAADAGGDLLTRDSVYHTLEEVHRRAEEEAEEPNLRALSFFFTGGIFVALSCICLIGLLDECKDEPGKYMVPKFWRIIWRFPAGILIVCLSLPNLDLTLLMGLVALITAVLLVYESIVSTPQKVKESRYAVEI
ncbi:hypothetical protein EJF18_80306 [Clavispora lusitaniae]|uniref:Uncharacterized protein n=1 Tax=Clavispora lusitaniae TaxID=36911 RepID=A0ACD0WT52_CLALS|nr:hypothetical protein EJF14_80306 [Clavispora lusitaniae]QFZ36245.1 hypothetical protein EJF16_80306 [Clavispora lusitaniae]QFZ41929.1 hypothetical protein EJF15_80306 [Clavispora lusitaniae]QFZ47605.1 hypothetical protein EJF18_80306 [Clavispora lusitaniae]QFZ53284.1 hypothetical protein EJF17_80306 [Clavispora lusitaniae]